MLQDYFSYALLGALAIALIIAAITDIRHRKIANWLTGGIALAAPAFWWACDLSLWPDIASQIGIALASFAILAGLFALNMMGGGDVKLLTALALWVPMSAFMKLIIIMALAGGVLTVMLGAWHVMKRRKDRLAIPYGVAISFAALWVIAADGPSWTGYTAGL
jgi:prepilin peptidase CpaA